MKLDERIGELAARQHGVIARSQLRKVGATDSAIRHRRAQNRLVDVYRGIFLVPGAPRTPRTQVLASVFAAGDGAAASHRTAAALYGLPGFDLRDIDITVPFGRRPRTSVPTIHYSGEIPHTHRRMIDAIPTTSVSRTLFDLCGFLHPLRAERALDNALARRLVTVPACWRVFSDLAEHGRAGTVLMRQLLEQRGAGYVAPASEMEAELLRILRDAGLPEPAREINVGDADGWIGRVELIYREQRVLIEADSRLHHTALLDRRSDNARDNRFSSSRWHVLRFDWDQITQHPHEVIRLVRRALHGFL